MFLNQYFPCPGLVNQIADVLSWVPDTHTKVVRKTVNASSWRRASPVFVFASSVYITDFHRNIYHDEPRKSYRDHIRRFIPIDIGKFPFPLSLYFNSNNLVSVYLTLIRSILRLYHWIPCLNHIRFIHKTNIFHK